MKPGGCLQCSCFVVCMRINFVAKRGVLDTEATQVCQSAVSNAGLCYEYRTNGTFRSECIIPEMSLTNSPFNLHIVSFDEDFRRLVSAFRRQLNIFVYRLAFVTIDIALRTHPIRRVGSLWSVCHPVAVGSGTCSLTIQYRHKYRV